MLSVLLLYEETAVYCFKPPRIPFRIRRQISTMVRMDIIRMKVDRKNFRNAFLQERKTNSEHANLTKLFEYYKYLKYVEYEIYLTNLEFCKRKGILDALTENAEWLEENGEFDTQRVVLSNSRKLYVQGMRKLASNRSGKAGLSEELDAFEQDINERQHKADALEERIEGIERKVAIALNEADKKKETVASGG